MKKTPDWFFWDWKSIRRSVFVFIFLILGLILIFNFSDWKRKFDSKNYTKNTGAYLIDVKPNESISMTDTGNKTIIDSYKVRYKYTVNNAQYVSIDIIPNSLENKKLIFKLFNNKKEKLKIKYDPKQPEKSFVIK
jgi:hypothetical protein